jgi:hypothetical protein
MIKMTAMVYNNWVPFVVWRKRDSVTIRSMGDATSWFFSHQADMGGAGREGKRMVAKSAK